MGHRYNQAKDEARKLKEKELRDKNKDLDFIDWNKDDQIELLGTLAGLT